jgi:hypothetical protein
VEELVNRRYSELAQELGHLLIVKDKAQKRIDELKQEINGLDQFQGYVQRQQKAAASITKSNSNG